MKNTDPTIDVGSLRFEALWPAYMRPYLEFQRGSEQVPSREYAVDQIDFTLDEQGVYMRVTGTGDGAALVRDLEEYGAPRNLGLGMHVGGDVD